MRLRFGRKDPDLPGGPKCGAVVAAAGASSRMGGQNKLLMEVGGVPVLARSVMALADGDMVSEIVVVARKEDMEAAARICEKFGSGKVKRVVAGGKTRLESVWIGVEHISSGVELIAVHDGARPFASRELVREVISAAAAFRAAAPAVPVAATLKRAKEDVVVGTVDREGLFEVQTPQVFDAALLRAALKNAIEKSLYITDDCMAVEAIGWPVRLTAGSRENIKLTTPDDVLLAEAICLLRGEKR